MSTLSVSSVGSKPLPPVFWLPGRPFQAPFSILSRIEASAALNPPIRRFFHPVTFSILSRIEASAAKKPILMRLYGVDFQYPQSDRSLCRPNTIYYNHREAVVFQYPQSDRSLCRSCLEISLRGNTNIFQYPQSDRSLCRAASTTIVPIVHNNFQYPQSDRSLCRMIWAQRCFRRSVLSVSSVGSKPLPRRMTAMAWSSSSSFSILSRIEASAADRDLQVASLIKLLSVSSVGSKPLPPRL